MYQTSRGVSKPQMEQKSPYDHDRIINNRIINNFHVRVFLVKRKFDS